MRLIQIVPAIAEEASGPSYSVVRLCEALSAQGQDVTLAALNWAPLPAPPPFLKTFPLGIGPRRLGRSPAMKRWLDEMCRRGQVDILHNHGMWQMNAVYPAWVARNSSVDLIYSPRGAFSEWAMRHGSKAKKLFWPLLQHSALQSATGFHATAESEYDDIRRLGFMQPVAIIPNGIDIPLLPAKPVLEYRTLLFLGRLHPKKGLDILLTAWESIQDKHSDWKLEIVGSDDGYHSSSGYLYELKKMIASLGLKRVEFSGAVYGNEKLQKYRDADLFVLPTHSENFGMTVAESLALATPAIVSKGAPWRGLERHAAGWWIDIGVDPLVACLEEALSCSPAQLAEMGGRGRRWMETEFSWAHIGQQMAETYRWLLDPSLSVPGWVRLD
ncbi:MAG TPA: glycosyltransferase [Gammaproteobacteria bacterium]|nr:glycosyltransferase [Gammaproteobacteria bacterium]